MGGGKQKPKISKPSIAYYAALSNPYAASNLIPDGWTLPRMTILL